MTAITRRRFLEDSMLAAAAAAVASPSLLIAEGVKPIAPSDTLLVAIIGCGIRGKQHAYHLKEVPGCEIAFVCDADEDRARQLAAIVGQQQARSPQSVQDLRRILDDDSVDAVFIAAPDHWHALAAIWAMEAGKDVYVEIPVCHNITEGRRIVQTARRLNRICKRGLRTDPTAPTLPRSSTSMTASLAT